MEFHKTVHCVTYDYRKRSRIWHVLVYIMLWFCHLDTNSIILFTMSPHKIRVLKKMALLLELSCLRKKFMLCSWCGKCLITFLWVVVPRTLEAVSLSQLHYTIVLRLWIFLYLDTVSLGRGRGVSILWGTFMQAKL